MKNTLYLIVIQTIASLRGNRDPPDGSKLALHQAEQKLYVAIKERELANSIGLKNASNKQKIAKGPMQKVSPSHYLFFFISDLTM